MEDLLERKLSTYILVAHGTTTPGDNNTYTIPKNMHLMVQSERVATSFSPRDDYECSKPIFSGIRYLWQKAKDDKFSITDLIVYLINK